MKTPEELYLERVKRVEDAINMRVPDRVPLVPDAEFFPFHYAGITVQDGMYNYGRAYEAWKKTVVDFEWDQFVAPFVYSAPVMDILDYRQLKWPGHGLEPMSVYQFQEPGTAYPGMAPEEYDLFLDDPSDYLMRKFFPQIFGKLAPFSKLPPFHGVICWYQGVFDLLAAVGQPDVAEAFEAFIKAGREAYTWLGSFIGFIGEMAGMGYPSFTLAVTHAPYDYLGNFLRGTRGIMTDLYRRPEKVLQTCERLVPWMIEWGAAGARATGNPIVSLFLHKGAEEYMSPKQYETFYWPTLRKVIIGLVDQGLIPYVYSEGDYTSRLETLRDVPKGKVIYHVEKDLFRAKEILGDVACLTGGPDNSLLCFGTPDEVMAQCKKIIKVVGKDGGFIMDAAAPIIEADPRNMKAMTEAIKRYGIYG